MGTFLLGDRTRAASVPPGVLVTEAAEAAGILLNTRCGNVGACGGCAVDILDGRFDLGGDEGVVELRGQRRRVLGCRVRILSADFRISVPRRSLVSGGERVLTSFLLDRAAETAPSVRRVVVDVEPATLEAPQADFERLRDALAEREGIEPPEPSLTVMRKLPGIAGAGLCRMSAVIARVGDRRRVVDVAGGDDDGARPDNGGPYGIAIDIGTTTVAMGLVDFASGRLVDAASSYNQQVRRCDDVGARIGYASNPAGLEELRRLVVEATIMPLARTLCDRHGTSPDRIIRAAVSGNTVMTHLFLGISPANIGAIPFNPAVNHPGTLPARSLGLGFHPEALVDIVPGMYGYVGGDITSDLYVVGARDADEPVLVVDIGTNGEMVLGNRGRMIACATPAGPAWEGGGLESGIRAATGAVERIRLAPATLEPEIGVIGEVAPNGICGSAYIDFMAEAMRTGLINRAGRFDPALCDAHPRIRRIRGAQEREVLAFVLVEASRTEDGLHDLVITEHDISELLKAKAAIFSGTRILMRRYGCDLDRIACVYLAGGFAHHIDLENAVCIGLLPDLPLERFRVVGNASLAGAWLALVERDAFGRMTDVAAHPQIVELNTDPAFEGEYVNALMLPNLAAEIFPGAISRLPPAVRGSFAS